jgi:hypothetical protein
MFDRVTHVDRAARRRHRKVAHRQSSIAFAVALGLLAGTAAAQQAPPPAAPAQKPATLPAQGWAHKTGLVDLKLHTQAITPETIVARLSIQDTFARWGVAYDEARLDVVATLFTKDAVYEVVSGSYNPGVKQVGVDNIVRSVAGALKFQNDQRRHVISNVIINKLTENEATALAFCITTVAANGLSMGATVIYSADLKREADGVWRFSRFVIGIDDYAGRPPPPDVTK